jgi:hypothetical protein
MSINLGSETLVTTNPLSYVVDDSYVRGGYRVVTTDAEVWAAASGVTTNPNYQAELQTRAVAGSEASIKPGCLVFDTTAGSYFRCSATSPAVTFVESFTGNSSLDAALYVQRTEIPTDANGGIDIASEATLQDALLSSVRVDNSGSLNIAFGAEERTSNDPSFRFVVDSVADLNAGTPAQISLKLNTAAANPFTA